MQVDEDLLPWMLVWSAPSIMSSSSKDKRTTGTHTCLPDQDRRSSDELDSSPVSLDGKLVQIAVCFYIDFLCFMGLFHKPQTIVYFATNQRARCYDDSECLLQKSLLWCKCFLEKLQILPSHVAYVCWLSSRGYKLGLLHTCYFLLHWCIRNAVIYFIW